MPAADHRADTTPLSPNGTPCRAYTFGRGDEAVFLLGTFPDGDETSLLRALGEHCPDRNFTLLCYDAADWNRDFSPWPSALPRGEHAPGGGPDTLRWLEDECVPFLRTRFPVLPPLYTLGYSLSGLFALWAFYESGLFAGCGCCSGSLWLDGWDDYAARAHAPADSIVYLSLGGKEEHSPDPLLSRVGDCTRRMDAVLAADKNIRAHTLVWNRGGHFANSGPRLAQAVRWLLGCE